jgi:hypothetical protein
MVVVVAALFTSWRSTLVVVDEAKLGLPP